jgi:hypothetical protein
MRIHQTERGHLSEKSGNLRRQALRCTVASVPRRARLASILLGCVCKVYITPNHKMVAAISHMAW